MNKNRAKTRFQTESLPAQFTLGTQEVYHAIVINESFTGACLVTRNEENLSEQMEIMAKVGKMGEIKAKIVWMENLDDDTIKFGIEYLK